MIDVVFPKDKERDFIKIAEKLGYSELCFAYQLKTKDDFRKKQKKTGELQKGTKLGLHIALLANPKNYHEAKAMSDLVLVRGTENNRDLIEKYRPDVLFDIEGIRGKDFIYSRNSGLNSITAKIVAKNKTVIGYSLSNLADSRKLGRIKQNIKLCRKYKIKEAAFSFASNPYQMRNPNDIISLLIVLGMTPGEAKQSLIAISEKIRENKEKKKPGYIAEGIIVVE